MEGSKRETDCLALGHIDPISIKGSGVCSTFPCSSRFRVYSWLQSADDLVLLSFGAVSSVKCSADNLVACKPLHLVLGGRVFQLHSQHTAH